MKVKAVLKRLSRSLFSHWLVLGVFFAIGMGIFGASQGVYAGLGEWFLTGSGSTVGGIIGTIAATLTRLLGLALLLVIQALLFFARYNDFISSPAVTMGWVIMRDMANMFFVFILLAIAIGTILQQEKYSYRTLLPGFIMAAILVNFSKTIAGFAIDMSQVVMNTFVAAFADTGGGNFAILLGIPKYLKLVAIGDMGDIVGASSALLLALAFTAIALVVVSMMTMMLLMRIIGLWFLIILSPWAFVLNLIPRGQTYASKWWDSFTNLVILGPVMAFFLWLSLAVVAQVNSGIEDVGMAETAGLAGLGIAEDANEGFDDLNVAGTEIGTFQGVIGYMLGIGMLLATMAAASELGAGGGKFAGQATGAITGWAAGKNGPSPMRFARERFDAYKGNRDSIRKDKAKRTGDALSSFQDRQVGKLPLVGERARARANVHDEKVLADAIDTTSKADKMDGMTVDDLRVLHKTGSKTQQIRAEQLLATKGRLTAADEDDIRRVSNYLTGTEIGRKLDDDIKAKNFEAAFAAKYMRGTGAARNVDTAMLTNDAVDGKVNLSSLTKEHAKSIKRADADYLTTLADNARDAQQLEKMAGSMNEEVKEMFASTITKTKADGISLSFDKRLALTKAKVAGFDIFDSDKVIEYAGKNQKNRDEVLQSLPSSFRAPAGQALVEKLYADIRIAPKEDDMKKMSAAGKTAWNNTTLEIITAANIAGDMSPAANRARDNAIKNQNKLTHDVAGVETNIYHDLNSPELSEFIKKSKAEDLKKLSLTQFGLPGSADQTAVLKQLADNLGTTKLGELAKEIADKDVIREVINYMRGPGGASVAELDSIRKNNNLSKYF